MIAIASGVLVFTGTFVEGARQITGVKLSLVACWVLLLLSISSSAVRLLLIDEFMSRFAKARLAQARGKAHAPFHGPLRGRLSTGAKYVAVVSFLAGLVAFGLFAADI